MFKNNNRWLAAVVFLMFFALANVSLGAFDWFHPSGIILVGGQNVPYSPATASPEVLRTNIVEAAIELHKSMPGRQVGIGMFWDHNGPKEFSNEHFDALVEGFNQAAEILGGKDNVVFLPFGGLDNKRLKAFREKTGINVGSTAFRHWRYNATDSRKLAEKLGDLNRLREPLRKFKYDTEEKKYQEYEADNMVLMPLVSANGGAVPGAAEYLVPDGKEDLWDYRVIQAWARMTRYYTELFSSYRSFIGITFDEPFIDLMDKKYRESAGAKARYKELYNEEMPSLPEKMEDRKGEQFVRLVRFLQGGINPMVEICRDAMHQTASWSYCTTPLVTVENPYFAYDLLRPSLDILQCDPYAYWDFQVPNTGFEWQIYDDCYDTVQTRAKVHVVFPRRVVWKYFSDKYTYEHGEPMSMVRNFRHVTPMVDMITDDIVFKWLNRIDGVLAWPIGRVTSKQEDAMLMEWVKKGNVLLLSNGMSFDELYNKKEISDDQVVCDFLDTDQPAGVPMDQAKIAITKNGRPEMFEFQINPHHPLSRAVPLRLKSGSRAEVFSELIKFEIDRMAGKEPLGVIYKVGKGAVMIYCGNVQTISSNLNIETDPYMLRTVRRALKLANVKPVNLSPDSENMVFLNFAGDYLTVYSPAVKRLKLSPDPAAYGLSGHGIAFQSVGNKQAEIQTPDNDKVFILNIPKQKEFCVLKLVTTRSKDGIGDK